MTDNEIQEIVTRMLHERLNQFGFAQARVKSELDVDGFPLIRVTARYENGRVPTNKLIDSLDDIRHELLQQGEERFVLLDSEYPGRVTEGYDDEEE
jgi:hypothetical protein